MGEALFVQRQYAKAQHYFEKAFAVTPTETAARYIYYSLIWQGEDLAAAAFRKRHQQYTFALPAFKKWLESIYTDLGVRFASGDAGSNGSYADAGVTTRLGAGTRLWQLASWLHEGGDSNHFSQYDYFASLPSSLGKGWAITPSLHYAHVVYHNTDAQDNPVSYKESYNADGGGTIVYQTNATQHIAYTVNGHAQYINAGFMTAYKAGNFTFEAEPVLHFMHTNGARTYQYTSTGTTDSIKNGHKLGTGPFTETGNGVLSDTVTDTKELQLGGAITYRLPFRKLPVTARVAAYYLHQNGTNAAAYTAHATLLPSPGVAIHLLYTGRGALPVALSNEGQYLNYLAQRQDRVTASVQLFPLKHWSPWLTWQYERNKLLNNAGVAVYQSVYVTLKYQL